MIFKEQRDRIDIAYIIYALLSFIHNDYLRPSYLSIVPQWSSVVSDKKLRRVPHRQFEGIFWPNLIVSYLKELPLPILIRTLNLYLKDILKNINSREYVKYCSILIFYSKENLKLAHKYFDVEQRTDLLYYIDIKHPVNAQALTYLRISRFRRGVNKKLLNLNMYTWVNNIMVMLLVLIKWL
jgi:hypothetical protein